MPKPVPRSPGLLSVDQLRKQVASGAIDTVLAIREPIASKHSFPAPVS